MRYARMRSEDDRFRHILTDCMNEAADGLSYRVCYTYLPVRRDDTKLYLGDMPLQSHTLDRALGECRCALIFAATVGASIDRMVQRYSRIYPSKALVMQAIGAERVEALCDAFCADLDRELTEDKRSLKRRVSPGYGDIPLTMQRDIFALLDCSRKIGVTLDDSLMMLPSKSVTAIAGVADGDHRTGGHKCSLCPQVDCEYRMD